MIMHLLHHRLKHGNSLNASYTQRVLLSVLRIGYTAKSLQSVTKPGVESAFTHWRPQGICQL